MCNLQIPEIEMEGRLAHLILEENHEKPTQHEDAGAVSESSIQHVFFAPNLTCLPWVFSDHEGILWKDD